MVRFSPDAIDAACQALRAGAPIYADSNMIRAGLSLARLQRVCPAYRMDSILCHVADADIADQARQAGLPRSLFAVRKAIEKLHGGIAVFGNAPVALLELNRLIQETGLRPALVIGMPVGFVHVVESKQELMAMNIPWITIEGRRGGSPLAVSVVHALGELAGVKGEG
jgi:precorrin isomerase